VKQHQKLLLGFLFGVIFGLIGFYFFPLKANPAMQNFVDVCALAGAIFLRLVFCVVVPLIVSAIILGVFELGKGRGLGKVAGRSLMYTLILSSLAVIIAVTLTGVLQPGAGLSFDKNALTSNASALTITKNAQAAAAKPWTQYIVDLLPQNPIDSAVRAFSGEIVALMIFSLVFGYALSLVIKEEEHPLIQFLDGIFKTSMKVIDFAIQIAPYGIFGLVFNTSYKMGAGFLGNLAFFAFTVVLGLLIQQFVVYGTMLKVVAGVNPWDYFKKCKEVYLYAFSTASSNATLPVALEAAEKDLKLPPQIARFVLTIGATANQNGTALFEGVTVLFLAQAYGIDLSLGSQFLIVLMSVLAGIGTAGVPGGSLPLIVVLLVQVGIPAEGIALILGVDRFLDMCRTTLNVSGDLVISRLVTGSGKDEIRAEDLAAKG
jgi:Na+/H+-dicarboxylate symporter